VWLLSNVNIDHLFDYVHEIIVNSFWIIWNLEN